MDIVLSGMPVDGRSNAVDFIVPHVRRSPLGFGPAQHLDVISCWKGVTYAQACELASWDCFFKECLAVQIKEYLQCEFLNSLSGPSSPRAKLPLMERMMDFLKHLQPLMIKVDMPRLVDDMIGKMYTTYRSDTAQRRFPWTLSFGDLPSLVYNFAHTQDCFAYCIDGPRVFAEFSSRFSQGDLTVYVDLDWNYEKTTFLGLRDRLSWDKAYRITPSTEVAGDGSTDRCNFSRAHSEATYSVGKSSLPLQWDDQRDCFYSPVSRGTQNQDGLMVTELSTKISTPFHSGVRFERISRYILRLAVENSSPSLRADIESWNEAGPNMGRGYIPPWVPSYTNTPLSKTGFGRPGLADSAQTHPGILQDLPPSHISFGSQPSISEVTIGEPYISGGRPVDMTNLFKPTRSPFQDRPQVSNPGASHIDHVGISPSYNSPKQPSSDKSVSPGKRKAWQPEASTAEYRGSFALDRVQHPEISVDPKRRKIVQDEDSDVSMNEGAMDSWLDGDVSEDVLFDRLARISTGFMGKAQSSTSEWYKKLGQDGGYSPPKTSSSSPPSKPRVASLGFSKQTSFVWSNPSYSQRRSAVRVDEVLDSLPDEISPTTTSSTASMDPLSQEQIQRNFQEFEQRKLKKAAEKAYYTANIPGFDGVVSPTDAEGKAFESIFLNDDKDNDADDWVSTTECVSEDMSAVSLEG